MDRQELDKIIAEENLNRICRIILKGVFLLSFSYVYTPFPFLGFYCV